MLCDVKYSLTPDQSIQPDISTSIELYIHIDLIFAKEHKHREELQIRWNLVNSKTKNVFQFLTFKFSSEQKNKHEDRFGIIYTYFDTFLTSNMNFCGRDDEVF